MQLNQLSMGGLSHIVIVPLELNDILVDIKSDIGRTCAGLYII